MVNILCELKNNLMDIFRVYDELVYRDYCVSVKKLMSECDDDEDFERFINHLVDEKKELNDEFEGLVKEFERLINYYFCMGGGWYNKLRVSYNKDLDYLMVKQPINFFKCVDKSDDKVRLFDELITYVKCELGLRRVPISSYGLYGRELFNIFLRW